MTTSHEVVTVSVVVVAEGWSEALLLAAIDNYRTALGSVAGEVILGSSDATGLEHSEWVEAIAGRTDCVFVPSVAKNRSGTINRAVAAARGEHIFVADEDWFLPGSAIEVALRALAERDGSSVGMLERRDLAPDTPFADMVATIEACTTAYVESSPRPSDNRGLAVLCRKDVFLRVRGLDEREAMSAHASQDFCIRLARAGETIEWFAEPALAAYHLVGGECPDVRGHGHEGHNSRTARLKVMGEDASIYRNLVEWSVPEELRPVLVTVCIATRDRGEYIVASVQSILAQTFADFEVIVVDDGSTDNTAELVASIDDPRVRYVFQEPQGISVARNRGADEARGHFTAVHDDDDLMLPWRLETSLATLDENTDASFGAWANFDDVTADMVLHVTREAFTQELLAHNGQGPGHATWLLPTSLIRTVRYDESLSAAVDINLAARLMWNGVRWRHAGRVLFLRRIHHRQVTAVDGGRQRSAALLTRYAAIVPASHEDRKALRKAAADLKHPVIAEKEDLMGAFAPYLPDHLVRRTGLVINNATNKIIALDRYDGVNYMLAEHDLRTGKLRFEFSELDEFTWGDIVRMRRAGVTGVRIEAVVRTDPSDPDADDKAMSDVAPADSDAINDQPVNYADRASDAVQRRLRDLIADLQRSGKSPAWLVNPRGDLTEGEIAKLGRPTRAVRLSAAADEGNQVRMDAIGYGFWSDALSAASRLQALVDSGRLVYMDPVSRDWDTLVSALTSREGI